MSTLERFFGRQEIEEHLQKSSAFPDLVHPVLPIWSAVSTLASGKDEFAKLYEQMTLVADLHELSQSIMIAERLPNFHTEMTAQLVTGDEANKYLYALMMAAMGVSRGYDVEFIPRAAGKTADLLFRNASDEFYVECKRKMHYLERAAPSAALDNLLGQIAARVGELDHDCDVLISVIGGLDPSRADSVALDVASLVGAGTTGYAAISRDCIVEIRRRPTNPARQGAVAPFETIGDALHVTTRIGVSPLGHVHAAPQLLCSLFVLHANSYAQLRRSFRRANSQLPADAHGVFCIDLDVGTMRCNEIPPYLELLAHWILREFTPTRHRRVAAVMLTTNRRQFVAMDPNHGGAEVVRYAQMVVNPHNEAGSRFKAAMTLARFSS